MMLLGCECGAVWVASGRACWTFRRTGNFRPLPPSLPLVSEQNENTPAMFRINTEQQIQHQQRIGALSSLLAPLEKSGIRQAPKDSRTTKAFAVLLFSASNHNGTIPWKDVKVELEVAFGSAKGVQKDFIESGEYGMELVVKVLASVRLDNKSDEYQLVCWISKLAHGTVDALCARLFSQTQPQPQTNDRPPSQANQEPWKSKKSGNYHHPRMATRATRVPDVPTTTETLPVESPWKGETKKRKRQELRHQIKAIRIQLEEMKTPEPAAPVAGPSGWKRARQDSDGTEKKEKRVKNEDSD